MSIGVRGKITSAIICTTVSWLERKESANIIVFVLDMSIFSFILKCIQCA